MAERVVALAVMVAPLLPFAAALPACLGGACTYRGCYSSETLKVALPVPATELESGQVSGCRNDQCWQGEIAVADEWAAGRIMQIELEPGFDEEPPGVRAQAWIDEERDSSFSLRFEWHLANYRSVKRGDRLRVSVLGAEGAEIVSREGSVTTVEDWYPNGEDCDETPCRSAHIEAR
jgi:hypothetical protein